MATTTERDKLDLGLLACGRCGQWDVDVDETTSGPERWFLQIEGPAVYFDFEIPSLDVVDQTLRFLRSSGKESNGEIVVGTSNVSPVRLLQDDEFEDRV